MSKSVIIVKTIHIPNVKVGDMIISRIYPDNVATLVNAQKVTKIHKNGTVRVECIDNKCKKVGCTYLHLFENELKHLKIDNTIKKSKRLSIQIL